MPYDNKYVGAPYNFIPFPKKVRTYEKETLPAHNDSSKSLLSGEINYVITAKTDIMIDKGTDKKNTDSKTPHHFFKDAAGRYAIPGSSLRGLIRSNAQILSLSSFEDDIDDYALMYRNVTSGVEKDRYGEILGADTDPSLGISVLKNVKAGYIRNEGGKYYITSTITGPIDSAVTGEMNYYVVSERSISEKYFAAEKVLQEKGEQVIPSKIDFCFDFFAKQEITLQHDITKGFEKRLKTDRNGNEVVHYIGSKSKNPDESNAYEPFEEPCSFENHGRKVYAIGPVDKYSRNGYVVGTGRMEEKKAIYIIPQEDPASRFEIPARDVLGFQIDMRHKETTLKQFGGKEHFDLPQDGKMRPVFYIQLGGRLYFGFTPRLRLFYDRTIKEGLPQSQKNVPMDYTRALFGYSTDKESYKTRVSFSDAVADASAKEKDPVRAIFGEPKPTSYLDYLSQDNGSTTYNTAGFQLRGVKQYWLHQDADASKSVPKGKEEKKYVVQFCPLSKGTKPKETKFTGKVRFHNLKADELGLLLYALQLDGKSEMNIGKGKAYGFGRIQLSVGSVEILSDTAYTPEGFVSDPLTPKKADDFINAYREAMREVNNGWELEDNPTIRAFFDMKDPAHLPDPEAIRYMDINAKEYQSRELALQDIREVLKMEPFEDRTKKVKVCQGAEYYGTAVEVKDRFVKCKLDSGEFINKLTAEMFNCGIEIPKGELKKFVSVGDRLTMKQLGTETEKKWECISITKG